MKKRQRIYRLPPCPPYDVEGTESWLSDMAADGWMLAEDGFFGGFVTFEASEPKAVRYRLEASLKQTSVWDNNNGNPPQEAVSLNEEYGWTYIARRGQFFIYRTETPGSRELNTDPAVQALAIRQVQKRQRGSLFYLLWWLLFYPLLTLRGAVLLPFVAVSFPFMLLTAGLALWFFWDALYAAISLSRLYRKLKHGKFLDHAKNWKKSRYRHYLKNGLQLLVMIVWIVYALHTWSVHALDEDKRRLSDYTDPLPFASMMDFAGEGAHDYEPTFNDLRFDYVRTWANPLSPVNFDYAEHARIIRKDGTVLDGGLYVEYHETIHPKLAERIAREYLQADRHKKRYELLPCPELPVEYAIAYLNNLHFPNLIVQDGNKVMHVMFYQTGTNPMEPEEWMEIAAAFLRNQT